MRPAPASKYNNTISDLNKIDQQLDKAPFIFKLNSYKNDAKKIMQDNPEQAYIFLGIIACIEDDIENMHKYHKNAINCSGGSVLSLYQYSSSLSSQDLPEEAYKFAYKAYEKAPDQKKFLEKLLHLAYITGRDDQYHELKTKMRKLGFDFQDPYQFPEDDKGTLLSMISKVDVLLEENPQMIVKPDSDFIDLVEDLVEGVDIS